METREQRIISGRGRFIDDIDLPNELYLAFANSTQAHAIIKRIDISKAASEPGVVRIITGKDCQEQTNPIPKQADFEHPGWIFRSVNVYALPVNKVHWFGEPIAAVVAVDEKTARRAANLIDVEYDPLPIVHDAQKAIQEEENKIYEEVEDNTQIHLVFDFGTPEKAFEESEHIMDLDYSEGRVTGLPIEPRGAIADYNKIDGTLTMWGPFQTPYMQCNNLSKVLNIPEPKIIVNTVDIGGSFGLKIHTWKEYVVALASKLTDKPVKYIETMEEFIKNGPHQRDVKWSGKVAFKNDGKILGLQATILQDLGAESSNKGTAAFGLFAACASVANMYHWTGMHLEAIGGLSNKSFYCAYRGYGKDKGLKFCEYLMNQVAKKIDISPEEIRFRNFIQPSELPHLSINGYYLDSGDYPATLRKAIELIKIDEWREEQMKARREGRLIGIGVTNIVEPAGASASSCKFTGLTQARVKMNVDGSVEVFSDRTELGQGAERSHIKIVSNILGCRADQVYINNIDSNTVGMGPVSSRGSVYPASAVAKASRLLRDKVNKCAAFILDTTPDQIHISEGQIYVINNNNKAINFSDFANNIYYFPGLPNLSKEILQNNEHFLDVTTTWYSPSSAETGSAYTTFSIAADIAVVEVIKETGQTIIHKYTHVHDAGTIIDRKIVEGQIYGGIAQALGESLLEEIIYDDDGSIRNTSLGEYMLPTALDMPDIEIGHLETPSPFTETGSKGMGESPTISGKATILAAINDALSPLNININFSPVTPQKLWQCLHQ